MSDALVDARIRFAAGDLEASEFHVLFLTSRIFFLTGGRPGFLAFGEPPHRVIAVFSGLSELARFVISRPELAGQENGWASTVGSEVLQLAPPGYDVVLDPVAADPVVIPAAARRAETVLTARRLQS